MYECIANNCSLIIEVPFRYKKVHLKLSFKCFEFNRKDAVKKVLICHILTLFGYSGAKYITGVWLSHSQLPENSLLIMIERTLVSLRSDLPKPKILIFRVLEHENYQNKQTVNTAR